MTDRPRIAIVMPLLNEAGFVREALDSLLAQAYEALEIVVYDGGSTDGTLDILRAYPVELRVEPGLGQMAAINHGWRATTAEFVTWMAGDDRLRPGALFRLAEALQAHPGAAAVHADAELIDERGRSLGHLAPGNVQLRELVFEFTLVPQTALIRRAALDRSGLFDESLRLAADYDLFLRLAQYHRLCHVPITAADYRVHTGSQDAQNQGAVGQAVIDVVTRFFQRPDLSPEQRSWRARGLAGAYLFSGTSRCLAGQRLGAWPFWWRAVRLQPRSAFATRRGLGLLLRLLSPLRYKPYQLRGWGGGRASKGVAAPVSQAPAGPE